ncbi:MAG: TonB-dependent receptor, partial [Bryobacteraceae bacterium]
GSQTGSPMLDFLLGDIGSLTQSGPELGAFRQSVLSLYGQDDIRVNSRLTVTAGLRWGPYLPTIDDRGRGNYFSQAAFAAGIKTNRYDNAPPGLLFNSDPGIPYRYANDRYLDLEPRVGIAWDPTGKGDQSVRASYSIIYDSPPTYWYTNWSDNPPWGAEITVPHPAGKLNDPWAGYPGGNPFPIPSKPSRTAPFVQGSIYQNSLLDAHLPYVQQWNISYQKQLGSDWLLSATYLGNKTTHLWIGIDQNPAVYMPGSCGAQPCSTLANTNQRRVLSLINPVSGAYYASMPNTYDGGNGEYNALLLSVKHRFSRNFQILTNYTYSHCIDDGGNVGDMYGSQVQDPNNVRGDRGNCESDFRHIFNTSFVVSSPAFSQPWRQRLLSNWQLSPIINVTSGAPFTVYTGRDNSLTAVLEDRPNVVLPNSYGASGNVTKWLNPAAFAAPLGMYGNAGRNSLTGPGLFNIDMAISRSFRLPLGEASKLEVRFEAFNVTNHVNFAVPTNTMTASNFGQIVSAADPRILQLALKLHF